MIDRKREKKLSYGMPAGFTDDVDNVGITVEHDPQVADNMTPDYVPRWVGTQLVSGTIFDNGNIGIGTESPGSKLTVAGGDIWTSGDITAVRLKRDMVYVT